MAELRPDGAREEQQLKAARKGPVIEAPLSARDHRRFEQQMELERRQVDRRLDRLERRIEEVASANASSGRWAELQGHVDGLEESLQHLIRRGGLAMTESKDEVMAGSAKIQDSVLRDLQGHWETSSFQLSELEEKVLQISGRLLQVESKQAAGGLGLSGEGEAGLPPAHESERRLDIPRVEMDVLPAEVEEQISMLSNQVAEMGLQMEEFQRHLEELMMSQEACRQVDLLGERTSRLRSKAADICSETALRQDLDVLNEDLSSLCLRVDDTEQGLLSLAEALKRVVCEEKGRGKPPLVVQPKAVLRDPYEEAFRQAFR